MSEELITTNHIIKHPNLFTTARYELTALEKNIIYRLIENIQKDMSKFIEPESFDVVVSYSSLVKDKNHAQIRRACKRLMSRVFSYTMLVAGKEKEIDFVMIPTAEYDRYDSSVTLTINSKAAPMLLELSKGYTKYSATVAISLKSVWSKRMYEFCNQWMDKGVFIFSVEKLQETLKLEGKYPKYADLKRKVLKVAHKELKDNADVYFEFKEIKKGRRIDRIQFKVYKREATEHPSVDLSTRVATRLKKVGFAPKKIEELFSTHSDKALNKALYETEMAARDGKIRSTKAGFFLSIIK